MGYIAALERGHSGPTGRRVIGTGWRSRGRPRRQNSCPHPPPLLRNCRCILYGWWGGRAAYVVQAADPAPAVAETFSETPSDARWWSDRGVSDTLLTLPDPWRFRRSPRARQRREMGRRWFGSRRWHLGQWTDADVVSRHKTGKVVRGAVDGRTGPPELTKEISPGALGSWCHSA
jgi:hypothetical protein